MLLMLVDQVAHADILKSAGKAITKGAKETGKAFEKAGKELSTAFNWEMNVKNNTPFKIYSAILEVDEKQQFLIGAKTAEWVITIATAPIGGGGASAAASTAGREVAETAGTIAAREIAETATTVAAREAAEAATTTAAREIAETATTTAAREAAESAATTGARAAARETTESAATTGARAAAREGSETTAQKVGTETAETTGSKVSGLSKAERVLGGKPSPKEQAQMIQRKAELNLRARYDKLFPKDSYKGGFSAWMEKNPQLLGDEVVKLGGTRPITPAVEKQAMENLKRAWIAEDTTQSFDNWANPQRVAKEIENVQAGKAYTTQLPSDFAETTGSSVTKPITEAPNPGAGQAASPTLKPAPKQGLPGSSQPIQTPPSKFSPTSETGVVTRGATSEGKTASTVDDLLADDFFKETAQAKPIGKTGARLSQQAKSPGQSVAATPSQEALRPSTLPRAVMEGSDVVPEGKIVEEAATVVKPTEIPTAPALPKAEVPKAPALPEPKAPTTPQVNKPSAAQLQEIKLKPAVKQEAPARPQDLLRESLAKRRTAWAPEPEEEIDEPIEAITRAATSKPTAPTAIPEAPSGIPAPPALPEAPVAKGPVIRPTQEELASRIGQGLRRAEPTTAPKPAVAKTTSLEDILKGAFAKIPAN